MCWPMIEFPGFHDDCISETMKIHERILPEQRVDMRCKGMNSVYIRFNKRNELSECDCM